MKSLHDFRNNEAVDDDFNHDEDNNNKNKNNNNNNNNIIIIIFIIITKLFTEVLIIFHLATKVGQSYVIPK